MSWIINNPWDAFMLLWSVILRPVLLVDTGVLVCFILIAKYKEMTVKKMLWISLALILTSSLTVAGIRVYGYLNPALDIKEGHENYAAHFNDVQRVQIVAAQKFGISPLKDRKAAEKYLHEYDLAYIKSNRNFQLAPMGHSIPYLTLNASDLLNKIGENFRDSLASKSIPSHKIVVTSILRTDADVERLMKTNNVAVKNSAHRYATTFDISYTQFVPIGISKETSRSDLKKVLAEVLRDIRDNKECYVKYEKSQNCFHITSRK